MATMNISMTLGLVDTASPQVKAFIGTLDSLLKAVAAVSERLTATVGGITGVGGASSSAASAVGPSFGAASIKNHCGGRRRDASTDDRFASRWRSDAEAID